MPLECIPFSIKGCSSSVFEGNSSEILLNFYSTDGVLENTILEAIIIIHFCFDFGFGFLTWEADIWLPPAVPYFNRTKASCICAYTFFDYHSGDI